MQKTYLALMATTLAFALQAQGAVVFDLTFSASGNVANGTLTANDDLDGTYTVISGSLTITASTTPSVVGSYTLVPGSGISPAGAFSYDSQLIYPVGNPYLFSGGLVWAAGNTEINLWGNSAGNYSLWASQSGSYTLSFTGLATTSITPVPEATTVISAGLLLLPVGVKTLRVLRRNRGQRA